jgi:hypothetical protein
MSNPERPPLPPTPLIRVALLEPEEGDEYRSVAILAVDPRDLDWSCTGRNTSVLWIGDRLAAIELAQSLRLVGARAARLDDRDTRKMAEEERAALERARAREEEEKGSETRGREVLP